MNTEKTSKNIFTYKQTYPQNVRYRRYRAKCTYYYWVQEIIEIIFFTHFHFFRGKLDFWENGLNAMQKLEK